MLVRSLLIATFLMVWLAGPASAQVADPHATIEKFDRARGQRNVDAALAVFADDAVVRLEDRGTATFSGRTEIRRFLQNVGMRSPVLVISDRLVTGDRVLWSERDQGQLQTPLDLSVEAVVEHGKITSLTYRPRSTALGQSGVVLPSAWAAGAIALISAALVALASTPGRKRSEPSKLNGLLVAALAKSRRQTV